MKRSTHTNGAFWLFLMLAVTTLGCQGEKSKKSSSPKAPEVTLGMQQTSADQQLVTYTTQDTGATLMCRTIKQYDDGTEQADSWSECPQGGLSVQKASDYVTVVEVKAVRGSKEFVIGTQRVGKKGGGSSNDELLNARAEIVEKSNVEGTYAGTSLKVSFRLNGASQELADSVEWKCQGKEDSAPKTCSNPYDFGQLTVGKEYVLAVWAYDSASDQMSQQDTLSFTVTGLLINGEEQLTGMNGQMMNQPVEMNVDLTAVGGSKIMCLLNNQPLPEYGQSGESFCNNNRIVLLPQTIASGQNQLRIEALDTQNMPVGQRDILFCNGDCQNQQANNMYQSALNGIQIGRYMTYYMGGNESIIQMSHAPIWGGNGSFLQSMGDDRNHTVVNCSSEHNPDVPPGQLATINGKQYCHRSMNGYSYDYVTNGGFSRSHVETVTNSGQERILVSSFDSGYEFNYIRSRFGRLCGQWNSHSAPSNIETTPSEVPVASSYWGINEFEKSQIFWCKTSLPGANGGFMGSTNWFVGVFYLAVDGESLPLQKCFGPRFTNDPTIGTYCDSTPFQGRQIIEVVYAATQDRVWESRYETAQAPFPRGWFNAPDEGTIFAKRAIYHFSQHLEKSR